MKKNNILLFHNQVTPYRLPLFEELNKYYNLTVFFGEYKSNKRSWSTSLNEYKFKSTILPNIKIGPLTINYTLIKELLKKKFDVYIVAENEENLFSILLIFVFAKICNRSFIIWSEQIERRETFNKYFHNQAKHKNLQKLYISLLNIYRKSIYKFTDAFASFSNSYSNQFLINRGVQKDKIFSNTQIMPKNLLEDNFTNKFNIKITDKKIILYLGYILEAKGLEMLIKAFIEINSKDTLLFIVGSGEDKEKYLHKYSKYKNIKFFDYVEGSDKAYFFNIASVFVLPTYFDAWGLVTNESLFYNLPIIISDSAASSQIIKNGVNGFIVKDGNYKDLKNRLDLFIVNDELNKQLKLNIKKSSKKILYDVEYGVQHLLAAINSVLK